MTVDHTYYLTQNFEKHYQYFIGKKDKYGEEFPILGTCQGFQLLALFAIEDDFSIMEPINVMGNIKVI